MVLLVTILPVKNAKLFADQPTAGKAIFTLKTVHTIIAKTAFIKFKRKTRLIRVNAHNSIVEQFASYTAHAI